MMEMDDRARAVLEQIATRAATQAVRDTLLTLGVDPANPLNAQKDFAALSEIRTLFESREFQEDLSHLRKWRGAVDSVQTKGTMTAVGILVSGLIGMLVLGVTTWFGK